MSFTDFLRVLRARWVLALSIFLAITCLTLVASLVWPKKYAASAMLMIDLKIDPVAGTSVAGVVPSAAYLATQVDIIESNHVALKVIDDLKLDDMPAFRADWEADGRKGDFRTWLAARLLSSLKVEAAREANIIELRFSDANPKFSQSVANAFAKAYIDSTVQFKTSPAKQYSEFFEERGNLARQKLERAQIKLAEAQKEKGILATDERLDAETLKLTELSTQLTQLRGALADSSSRNVQASRNAEVSPEALASPLLTALRTDLSRQQAKLDEGLERYGDNHPMIIEARASIASTQEKIRQEIGRVNRGIGATDQINQSRMQAIQVAYDEQRQKLLKLKESRNELLLIEREVAAAQRVYDAIQARQSQMSLEGSNSQNNIVVLNAAAEPTSPASPRVGINTLIGAVLGLILAAAVTVLTELSDRTVRGTSDLVNLLHTPVIGFMSSRIRPRRWWAPRAEESVLYPLETAVAGSLEAPPPNMSGRLL